MWRLYIIYHRYIRPEFHEIDPSFDKTKVHLLQTKGYTQIQGYPKDYSHKGYITHKESDFKKYNPDLQKKKYFAPSALYHVYKNSWYTTEYIGFLEYDFKLEFSARDTKKLGLPQPPQPIKSSCKLIENNLKPGRIIILSSRWRLQELNAQKTITVSKVHWFDHFLLEYNKFYSKELSKDKLLKENPIIPTQQSFICDIESFKRVMEFVVHLIDNSLVEKSYPAPATILERYIGLCIHLSELEVVYFPLSHQAHHGYQF